MPVYTFCLNTIPPFRLDLTVWALRRRAENTWDLWDGRMFRRVLALADGVAEARVVQIGSPDRATLEVTAAGDALTERSREEIGAIIARTLGVSVDLGGFYRLAAGDAGLGPLAERFRGVKPPRFPSLFEALVNAIACQQMSLTFGIGLLSDLVSRYGRPMSTPTGERRAFPQPDDLLAATPMDLRGLRFSRQKAGALLELAAGIARGSVDPAEVEAMDDATAMETLRRLRGVGRWTAEYALLRGLGRIDVFPGDDAGGRRNLARWLGLPPPSGYEEVAALVRPWHPYGGLVYLHLLLDRLDAAGLLG